jgi:hypothetical protein
MMPVPLLLLLNPLDTQDRYDSDSDILSILHRTENMCRSDSARLVTRIGGRGNDERLLDEFAL